MKNKRNKIDEAVLVAKTRINCCQVAIRLLEHVEHFLRDNMGYSRDISRETNNSLNQLKTALYEKLNEAWSNLNWLTPISKEAQQLISLRTADWFKRSDCEIMSWLGVHGTHLAVDEEEFRKQVCEALGVDIVKE